MELKVEYVHPFVKAVAKQDIYLRPYNSDVYACDGCGCIFIPSAEGDKWYPDRYEFVGENKTGCTERCTCHEIGYTIDRDGNPTAF